MQFGKNAVLELTKSSGMAEERSLAVNQVRQQVLRLRVGALESTEKVGNGFQTPLLKVLVEPGDQDVLRRIQKNSTLPLENEPEFGKLVIEHKPRRTSGRLAGVSEIESGVHGCLRAGLLSGSDLKSV